MFECMALRVMLTNTHTHRRNLTMSKIERQWKVRVWRPGLFVYMYLSDSDTLLYWVCTKKNRAVGRDLETLIGLQICLFQCSRKFNVRFWYYRNVNTVQLGMTVGEYRCFITSRYASILHHLSANDKVGRIAGRQAGWWI